LLEIAISQNNINEERWSRQIINDNELKFDFSFMGKPDYVNFSESALTVMIFKLLFNYQ
jgi:hypothetical protein